MLRNLQHAFIDDIFTASESVAERVSEDGFLNPAQRLQIYKNNTRLALTELGAAMQATVVKGPEAVLRIAHHHDRWRARRNCRSKHA